MDGRKDRWFSNRVRFQETDLIGNNGRRGQSRTGQRRPETGNDRRSIAVWRTEQNVSQRSEMDGRVVAFGREKDGERGTL